MRAFALTVPLLSAGALLTSCETDKAAVSHVSLAPAAAAAAPAPQAATPQAPAPAAAPPAQTAVAPQPAPAEPVTEQQASAACWMKFEGRRGISLDTRAKLVNQCIDDRLKAGR